MTMHKLTAGDGYQYLIRQVAAVDDTARGVAPLIDYYSAKGESPGRWVGSGLPSLNPPAARWVTRQRRRQRVDGRGRLRRSPKRT